MPGIAMAAVRLVLHGDVSVPAGSRVKVVRADGASLTVAAV